jgi:CheY-like chemotaxis protein
MDDDAYVTELLCTMLNESGYETCAASNGEEAIQRFTRARALGRPINTVILDLNIPSGMDGCETFSMLREMDPGVRAILLTGDISHPEISSYRESGFRAALLKPFTRAELLQAINWTSGTSTPDGTASE